MLLSRDRYSDACRHIETQGRPLEVARMHSLFDGAPVESVWRALAAFQNPDGGFGHALEPDLRIPDSSAVATTHAFQIARELGVPLPEAMLRPAIAWLLDTYDAQQRMWRIVPRAEVMDQGPWWNRAVSTDENVFGMNPTVEILGYLIDHAEMTPEGFVAELTPRIVEQLDAGSEVDQEELNCWVRLIETPGLHDNLRERMITALRPHVTRLVAASRDKWAGYGLRPVDVATTPNSPFADLLAEILPDNLDYEVETQASHGGWEPTWTWEEGSVGWPVAKREWGCMRTLQRLLILRGWGRIA